MDCALSQLRVAGELGLDFLDQRGGSAHSQSDQLAESSEPFCIQQDWLLPSGYAVIMERRMQPSRPSQRREFVSSRGERHWPGVAALNVQ